MKLIVNNLRIIVEDTRSLRQVVLDKFRTKDEDLLEIIIVKKSIDARQKDKITIIYSLIIDVKDYNKARLLQYKEIEEYIEQEVKLQYHNYNHKYRPIIIGFGPSGIFSALYLARSKAKPIIIERGSKMEERVKEVDDFLNNKKLNTSSNIQFGEGGAGTFSDGKLTTNVKDELNKFILQELVKHGAPKEILYEGMPHIGTDYLEKTIKSIREEIETLGGSFYFNHQFTNIENNQGISKIEVTNKDNKFILETDCLILGLGHSARDTIKMLYSKGLQMEAKSFSMGVRIEHKQEYINKIQYGEFYKMLPPASYKVAVHLKNRSVYTFCMCPGGQVMASQSEEFSILTNGMSKRNRDMENSNAALLVNVDPVDYYKTSILDGLDYQEKYEKLAYEIAGDYKAPANLVKEFLNNKVAQKYRSVTPSYPHGVTFTDLNRCLPNYVVNSLKEALPLFDKKMRGFAFDDAVLTGVETRTSCPIRMTRNEQKEANIRGIYPIGEGAGYAGGIMSAALDGLKTAIKICEKLV